MWYYMHNYGGAWWMMIVMFLFWAGVIGLAVWGITRLVKHDREHVAAGATPLEIARQRYAKGEINKEQFEQIKKDLV